MKYKINESLLAFDMKDEGILLNVTDNDLISVEEKEDVVLKIIMAFLEPRSFEQAFKYVLNDMYIDESDFNDCFEFMRLNNMLKECMESESVLSEYQKMKYSKQISSLNSLKGIEGINAEEIQKKICDSTVCIVGIGGTGSYLALALAMIGVEHLILIDFDVVELSNTSRQVLYDELDVGKYKIDVAKKKLQRYNKNLKIDIYNVNIKSIDDLSFLNQFCIDLLVLCADTPRGEIQYIVDKVTNRNSIPWFCYGPLMHSKIIVGPMIIPGRTKSYEEIFPRDLGSFTGRVVEINKNFKAFICDPYNGFASQFAAIEVMKYLSGVREPSIVNRKYYIDTDSWSIEYESYDE